MDGAYGRRRLALFSCVLAVAVAGCADFGGVPSWVPFQKQAAEDLSGIPSPAERIAELRELAQNASGYSADEKQQIAARLSESIQSEEDPLIRAEIVRTLGAYPGPEADGVLRAAVSEPDADVRVAACEVWGNRGDAEAAALLGGVLGSDVDRDVRLAAARALGQCEDPAAVATLGSALEDKDPAMQYRAVLSLRKITGKDLGNDVNRWRQYVKGELPTPAEPISIAERLRQMF